MNTEGSLTTEDWFALMEADKEALRALPWVFDQGNEELIRTLADQQCPICAWVELKCGQKLYLSWGLALKELFGPNIDPSGACPIADAADHEDHSYRGRLLTLLNLTEDAIWTRL